MVGKMGTKFCFGNSPISSGYAIGYFGIAMRLFLIPNLIALASYKVMKMHKMKEDMEAEPEGEFENGTGIHFEKVITNQTFLNFFSEKTNSKFSRILSSNPSGQAELLKTLSFSQLTENRNSYPTY